MIARRDVRLDIPPTEPDIAICSPDGVITAGTVSDNVVGKPAQNRRRHGGRD
jgi:hypothetical protein